MSELAQRSRAAMKDKIKRMLGPGPGSGGDIDASGWREPTDMNANAQTGLRPVSRQARKRGGKVEGHASQARADRKPRKSGGRANANDYINRNVKDANEALGKPHDGGYARSGSANFRKQMHADVAEDARLGRHMKSAGSRSHKRNGGGQWIQSAIGHPGALHRELHVPEGQKIPAKKLNKAAHSDNPRLAKRANLAKTLKRLGKAGGGLLDDVLASQKKPDVLAMADTAATPAPKPLEISPSESGGGNDGGTSGGMKRGGRSRKAYGGSMAAEAGMRPKGARVAKKGGGRTKSRTNILINITPHQAQPMPAPAAPVRPPVQVPTPAAPAMPPPQMAGGAPPMMGLGAGGPQMPMPRKAGGRTMPTVAKAKRARSYKDMDASASAGLGRIEKSTIAERRM